MKSYTLPNFTNPLTPERIEVGSVLMINTVAKTLSVDACFCIGDNAFVHRCENIPFEGDWRDVDAPSLVLNYLTQFEV
jgi:hypothetical protein